jgi:hypothetical protein
MINIQMMNVKRDVYILSFVLILLPPTFALGFHLVLSCHPYIPVSGYSAHFPSIL